MLGILFFSIAAIIATGIVIAHIFLFSVKWLISKVKNMLANRNVKKVAAMDLQKLIDECPNQTSLADLDADYIFASVDDCGNIAEVEGVKADNVDYEVKQKLGSENMIVINR